MGILRATKYKTFLKLSAAVFLLLAVVVSTLSSIIHTSAATTGLTFRWNNAQTVVVSGTVNGSLVQTAVGSTQFKGPVTPTNLCNTLTITVDIANITATLENKPTGQAIGIAGENYCYAETFGITSPQPISGTRPTSVAT